MILFIVKTLINLQKDLYYDNCDKNETYKRNL